MPGPRQHGTGLQAFVINLLAAQMLSLRPVVELLRAISGLRLSETTFLGYIRRLRAALQAWEEAASARLLAALALHADETGLRVEGKNHWLQILTDGSWSLKFLHSQARQGSHRGDRPDPSLRAARWCTTAGPPTSATRTASTQLCGAHLVRELTFLVESNGYRWARLMKALQQQACHKVNASQSRALSAAACKALRKRYRTILTQGRKELPALPPAARANAGRTPKSDALNLHERLAQHEASALRFLHDPAVSFTNNDGERGLRMPKSQDESVGLL